MLKYSILFLVLFAKINNIFGQKPLAELINHAVLINIGDYSGSGFFILKDKYIYLVTAKHVLFDLEKKEYLGPVISVKHYSSLYNVSLDSIRSSTINLDVALLKQTNNIKSHSNKDIIVARIGLADSTHINFLSVVTSNSGNSPLNVMYSSQCSLFKDVKVTDDVYISGFPSSLDASRYLGVSQYDFKMPLVRKGIVAGKNYSRKLIVLDCPTYYGNSGGPVFRVSLFEGEPTLMGIVSEYIPMVDVWQNTRSSLSHIYTENSGYSLIEPLDEVFTLISSF